MLFAMCFVNANKNTLFLLSCFLSKSTQNALNLDECLKFKAMNLHIQTMDYRKQNTDYRNSRKEYADYGLQNTDKFTQSVKFLNDKKNIFVRI